MLTSLVPEGTKEPVKSVWEHSALENGLKMVSRDRGGDVATIALFVRTGPRFEGKDELGMSDMVRSKFL